MAIKIREIQEEKDIELTQDSAVKYLGAIKKQAKELMDKIAIVRKYMVKGRLKLIMDKVGRAINSVEDKAPKEIREYLEAQGFSKKEIKLGFHKRKYAKELKRLIKQTHKLEEETLPIKGSILHRGPRKLLKKLVKKGKFEKAKAMVDDFVDDCKVIRKRYFNVWEKLTEVNQKVGHRYLTLAEDVLKKHKALPQHIFKWAKNVKKIVEHLEKHPEGTVEWDERGSAAAKT